MSDEASPVETDKRVLTHSYGISYDLGNNRSIQLNGAFVLGWTEEQVNADLDLQFRVLERQRAKYEVEALESAMEQLRKQKANAEEQIVKLSAELVPAEGARHRQPKDTLVASIENLRLNILKMQQDEVTGVAAIEAMRKKAA